MSKSLKSFYGGQPSVGKRIFPVSHPIHVYEILVRQTDDFSQRRNEKAQKSYDNFMHHIRRNKAPSTRIEIESDRKRFISCMVRRIRFDDGIERIESSEGRNRCLFER